MSKTKKCQKYKTKKKCFLSRRLTNCLNISPSLKQKNAKISNIRIKCFQCLTEVTHSVRVLTWHFTAEPTFHLYFTVCCCSDNGSSPRVISTPDDCRHWLCDTFILSRDQNKPICWNQSFCVRDPLQIMWEPKHFQISSLLTSLRIYSKIFNLQLEHYKEKPSIIYYVFLFLSVKNETKYYN